MCVIEGYIALLRVYFPR